MSAVVYRAYDAADRLLYVGCTVDLESRLREHAEHSAWSLFYVRVESEQYTTKSEALEMEALAIATEHPRWNMRGRSEDHPDGFCTSYHNSHWLDYEFGLWRRVKRLRDDEAKAVARVRQIRFALTGAEEEIEAIRNGHEVAEDEIA